MMNMKNVLTNAGVTVRDLFVGSRGESRLFLWEESVVTLGWPDKSVSIGCRSTKMVDWCVGYQVERAGCLMHS